MNKLFAQASVKLLSVLFVCIFLAGCSNVQFPQVQDMLANVESSLPGLWRLVSAASYLFGMVFILRGVYQLKVYGDMKTMMSTQTNIKATLMLFLVGAVLIFSQSMFQSLMVSTFGNPQITPLSYSTDSSGPGVSTRVILEIVQLVGFVSFIRGWIYLTQASQGGHSNFGKAMTHIIGGLLAINIQGASNVLQATFGISVT